MFCVWTSSPVNMFVCNFSVRTRVSHSQARPQAPPPMTKHKTCIVVVFYFAHRSWKKPQTELRYKGKTKRPSLMTAFHWFGIAQLSRGFASQRTPKQDGLQRRVSLHETNWLNICVLADERESRFLKVLQCSLLPEIGETCSWSHSPCFDLSPAVEAVIR